MSVIKVNESNFDEEVLNSIKPVLVDFNADWCGPCKMLGPILEEVSQENMMYKICSINVDESRELAIKYDISSIPCLILFKDGKELSRTVGFRTKAELEELLG